MVQLLARGVRALRAPSAAALVVMLVATPTIAMLALAGRDTQLRWEVHEAAGAVQRDASTVRSLVALQAAVTEEAIDSGASVAAAELGVDGPALRSLLGFNPSAEVTAGRATVDATPRPVALPEVLRELEALQHLREAIDAGTASWDDVVAFQQAFRRNMATALDKELARLEVDAAATGDYDRDLVDAVDAMELLVIAFRHASERLEAASRVLEGPLTAEDRVRLIETDAAFQLAISEANELVGPSAAAAAAQLGTRASTAHFDALVDEVRADPVPAGGRGSSGDLLAYGRALRDGAEWLIGVNAVLQASAEDVWTAAAERDRAATRALREMALAVTLVLALTGAVTAATARVVVHTSTRLTDVAYRIAEGDYHAGAQLGPPSGPREARAIHSAMGDMSRALSALEQYVVDLADDPTSPSLDRPLPGATGQALQVTLDRLRAGLVVNEETRSRLAEAAAHDTLTGLLNRGAALAALEHELHEDRRGTEEQMLAALFIDLDALKELNDSRGHAAGDAALRLLGDALRQATRRSDIVARLGGDEFLVVVRASDVETVSSVAARIQAELARRPLPAGEGLLDIECSIGIALALPGDDVEALLRRADAALYRAKGAGGSRVVWDDPTARGWPQRTMSAEREDLVPDR